MPTWLLLQSEAGFPLFSRSAGLPSAAFSFATTGLLAAAQQAAAAGGFVLTRLQAHDAAVHASTYPGGLILVLASSEAQSASPAAMAARAQRAHDALLFLLGRAKMQDLRHVERTKRHIRSAAHLLSLLLVEDTYLLQMGTGIPECCIASSSKVFDDLRLIASGCNVQHAALYAQHRMYAWTDEWTKLDSRDLFTISAFLRSSPPAQARDVPVYLAHSSLGGAVVPGQTGRTPYRLLTISLLSELELVLLCGPNPSLVDAISSVAGTILRGVSLPHSSPWSGMVAPPPALKGGGPQLGEWSTMYQSFLRCQVDFPRRLPGHFSFFSGILGFVYVVQNSENGAKDGPVHARQVCSFLPQGTVAEEPAPVTPSSSSFWSRGDKKDKAAAAATARNRSPSPSPSPSPSGKGGRRVSANAGSSVSANTFLEPPSPSSQLAPSNRLFSSSLLSDASILSRSHALLTFIQLIEPQINPPCEKLEWEPSPPPTPERAPMKTNQFVATPAEISLNAPAIPPFTAGDELPRSSPTKLSPTTHAASAYPSAHNAAAPAMDRSASLPLESNSPKRSNNESPSVVTTDAYMLTPKHGFYACRQGNRFLYVMFGERVPASMHLAHAWALMGKLEAMSSKLL
jgi:hypothetical protein